MTIKIEDLPKGRNIKNIVFDITFEDGAITNVKPTVQTIIEKHDGGQPRNSSFYAESPKETPLNHVENSAPGYNPNIKPSIVETKDDIINKPTFENTITREKKEVPKEMLDFNF